MKLHLRQKNVGLRRWLTVAFAGLLIVCPYVLGQKEKGSTPKMAIFLQPLDAENRLTVKVPIDYPPAARQGHMEGPVKVRVLIDREGKVKKMTPISGNPMLLVAAMDSIAKWRYRPYKINGELVEFESDVNFRFVL